MEGWGWHLEETREHDSPLVSCYLPAAPQASAVVADRPRAPFHFGERLGALQLWEQAVPWVGPVTVRAGLCEILLYLIYLLIHLLIDGFVVFVKLVT